MASVFPLSSDAEIYSREFDIPNALPPIYVGSRKNNDHVFSVSTRFGLKLMLRQFESSLTSSRFVYNELAIIEYNHANAMSKNYDFVLKYNLSSNAPGVLILKEVAISCGIQYARVYAGSQTSFALLQRYQSEDVCITRIQFADSHVKLSDLEQLIHRVFLVPV